MSDPVINPEERTPEGLPHHLVEYYAQDYRFRYANALVTHCVCGGHGKAERNEQLAKIWAKKVKEFGGKVPSQKEALSWGRFNAVGST